METLFQRYVVGGGVMMVALIPCLVLTIAFAVQAVLNLRRRRIAPVDYAAEVGAARRNGGMEQARKLLESDEHSLAVIIRNVDSHLQFKPDADAADVLREQIEIECDALIQQNSQLAVIYRVAPLMGLLGTVFGMIKTFNDFAEAANPDVQQLSIGINIALITTAWGLSIAIPAYICLYLIQRRIATYEQLILPNDGAETLHALLDRAVAGRVTRPSSQAVETAQADT